MIYLSGESFQEYDDIYFVNGYTYFKCHSYSPEISGWYEVLFDFTSASHLAVKNGVIKPYVFYNSNENRWYLNESKHREINKSSIIGWRDYLIEFE